MARLIIERKTTGYIATIEEPGLLNLITQKDIKVHAFSSKKELMEFVDKTLTGA
jgi:hypothetical protein